MSPARRSETEIRPFDYAADLAAIKRIWREVGWVDADDEKHLDHFFAVGHTRLATLNGEPECSVHITEGTLRLQKTDLPLCAVTAVTTSRVARGHAFAKRLTALQLREGALQGAAVAALGMFDQGFYDQLGFGTGAYDNQFSFDPASLNVSQAVSTPRRLGIADFALIHAAMCNRAKVHGSVVLHPARLMQAELGWGEKSFGLGYYDGSELTHFLWMDERGEHGPYVVKYMAYQNPAQMLELMGLLKSLADQVYSVRLTEPPEIQFQSLLSRPFRSRALTKSSPHETNQHSYAWWQLRILDVARCVAAFTGDGELVRLQLDVVDPVQEMLQRDEGWCGIGGQYIVELGATSQARQGADDTLPLLRCSVNALTRMLWGVAKPSSLAITDEFDAPDSLLEALDKMLHLPAPHAGWEF
jgi:hypothetical protein